MKAPVSTPQPPRQLNRRDFLKTSTVAASAVAASTLDLARSAYAAGSDVLRVGMIGCGGRNAGAAVQALTADKGARLVAMCDIFRERVQEKLEEIRRQKPDQVAVERDHCFTGFEGYQHVIGASDVVLIANAAKFHPFHALAALQAGKHVFVEKPHGIDPLGIRTLRTAVDLAHQKKLCLVSGLQSRHHPGYQATIQRIHDGAIGDIVAIEENFLRGPYGVIPRRAGLSELEWQVYTQYHFNWLSGDDVPQSLVHNLDRARWALHEAVPLNCHGLGGRSTMVEPIYGNVFDHHSVIYEFPEGVRVYAFCRTTNGCYDESSSRVLGSKGQANVTACRIRGETNWQWPGAGHDPHQADPYQIEHDRLFAAIRSGNPVNNGDYMARSTLTAIMGQVSCYTGKQVAWDQINASDFHYPLKPEDCHDGMDAPVTPGADGSYPVYKPGETKLI
jgi:myo-inositol 2-dehydrogenase / D-chiro-inositol 1-dehydrogenase